jgi:hypothetical protein
VTTDQSESQTTASPCNCSAQELKFCLRWIDEHGAPCEWTQAAENEYLAALKIFRSAVAA